MGKMNKEDILDMIETREKALITFLSLNITNGDITKAFKMLYASRTYKELLDTKGNFYWKSENELIYLLQMELSGNMAEWEINAVQ